MGKRACGQRWVFLAGAALGVAGGALALAVSLLGFTAAVSLLPPMEVGPLVSAVIVEVPAGATARDVGHLLRQQGLIRSAAAFVVLTRLTGVDAYLQAGHYRLRPDMTLGEVVQLLARGGVAVQDVTIPEGLTVRAIGQLLERRGLADAQRFIQLASDDRWLFADARPFDKPPGPLEGYLFPDTYRFAVGQSEESIIRKMVTRFVDRMVPLYRELGSQSGLSLHEAVTLASIIEKEAMRDGERSLVSSVFHNRLRRGLPLQADPTLLYVLDPPPRRLLREHLAIESPYNTYRYKGLPPTPIASPGVASFRAALQPAGTDYLYFVARGDGSHIFSRTFRDHVRARRLVSR